MGDEIHNNNANPDWLPDKTITDIITAKGSLPEDLVVFWGYAAESPSDGFGRLYQNMQFNEYIEFQLSDLVWQEDLGNRDRPLAGRVIGLQRDAVIKHVRVETLELQRGFLQGNIAGLNANAGAGSFGGGAGMGGGGGGGTFSPACGGGGTWSPACGDRAGTFSPACGGGGTWSPACGD